jgi:hypothetical protein
MDFTVSSLRENIGKSIELAWKLTLETSDVFSREDSVTRF